MYVNFNCNGKNKLDVSRLNSKISSLIPTQINDVKLMTDNDQKNINIWIGNDPPSDTLIWITNLDFDKNIDFFKLYPSISLFVFKNASKIIPDMHSVYERGHNNPIWIPNRLELESYLAEKIVSIQESI